MHLLHALTLFITDKLKGKKKCPANYSLVYYIIKKQQKKKGQISLGATLTPNSSCQ